MRSKANLASILTLTAGLLLAACSSSAGGGAGDGGGQNTDAGPAGAGGTGGALAGGAGGSAGSGGAGTGGSATGGAGAGGMTTAGTGGSAMGGSGGAGGSAGECEMPACEVAFRAAAATCQADGACVAQKSESAMGAVETACYANGAKMHTEGGAGGSYRGSLSKNGTVCYSFEGAAQGQNLGPLAVKDGAGKPVMTFTANADMSMTITCPDGSSRTLAKTCNDDLGLYFIILGLGCTEGTCM